MRRKWRSTRIVSVVVSLLVAAVWAGLPQPAHAAFTPIASGDLIVSLTNGSVNEYTPSGTFVQTLMVAIATPAGSAFDGHGNLYVAEFSGNAIRRLDATTGAVTVFSNNTILADGTKYNSPESVAFDSGFTKLYTSDANRFGPGGGIHVVDASTGKGLDFLPIKSSSGSMGQGESDWLAFNASNNLYMTNENPSQGIMQVNQTTKDIVSPSFVPNLPNFGYALSFDKKGDVWVGDTNTILEYSPAGVLMKTITNPKFSVVFAAVFNPAGDTFYAGDLGNGNVYTYDLNGTLQGTFNAGGGFSGVSGLSVAGASLPNQPPSDQPITAKGTTISATEGALFKGTVATFTDPDPKSMAAEYSATINWGDSTPATPGTVTGPTGGPFTVTGSHTYAEEGTYKVTVTITDKDEPSNTATVNSAANVSDAALTAAPACPAVSLQSYTGPTATFKDAASPYGTLSDFSATISWGDSSSSAGKVSGPNGGPYAVSGSHTYTSTGPFTITTNIKDVGGSTATTSCTTIFFAFPSGGSFVVGDQSATGKVLFWGAQWAKVNSLSGGPAPASFKGFENSKNPPVCKTGWTTDPGNSADPPATIPQYMGVIVSSKISKTGSTISGDTVRIVVVKTDPGYAPNPGHPGTGTVLASVC
jgi:hypothetical protein